MTDGIMHLEAKGGGCKSNLEEDTIPKYIRSCALLTLHCSNTAGPAVVNMMTEISKSSTMPRLVPRRAGTTVRNEQSGRKEAIGRF